MPDERIITRNRVLTNVIY